MDNFDFISKKPQVHYKDHRNISTSLPKMHGRRLDTAFNRNTQIKCPKCGNYLFQNPLNGLHCLFCMCGWKGRPMTQFDMDAAKNITPHINLQPVFDKYLR